MTKGLDNRLAFRGVLRLAEEFGEGRDRILSGGAKPGQRLDVGEAVLSGGRLP